MLKSAWALVIMLLAIVAERLDNLRRPNMSYATVERLSHLLQLCLEYIPRDGDEERDLRDAIEDALKEVQ